MSITKRFTTETMKDIKNAENLELQEALEQSKARDAQSAEVTNKLSELSSQVQLIESTNEDLARKLIKSNNFNLIVFIPLRINHFFQINKLRLFQFLND